MNTIAQIEEMAQSASANQTKIADQLFEVKKVPLFSNIEGFEAPINAFGMYRTNGKHLGNVGATFTATQPKLLFDSFIQHFDNNSMNELQYKELRGGSKIVFEAPIKTLSYKNKRNQQDETILKINLITGFDGMTKTALFVSCYRMVCANGMKAYRTEFNVSYKNTLGNIGKASSMLDDVNKAIEMAKDLEEAILLMDKVQVNPRQVAKFVAMTLGIENKIEAEIGHKMKAIKEQIDYAINLEFERTGTTLNGLLNGITYYTNHLAKHSMSNDEYLLVGSGETLNDKAQSIIYGAMKNDLVLA